VSPKAPRHDDRTGRVVDHDGTRYRVDGAGHPLVLIHGVGMDLTMWDAQTAALGRHLTVIRYDMLGHGGSATRSHAKLRDFVDQLRRLLDHLSLDRVYLVGFSMGGMVAQAFAVHHPDRVARLVIMSAVYDRPLAARAAVEERVRQVEREGVGANLDAALKRWFTPAYAAAHPEALATVRRRFAANDPAGYLAAYRVFATGDVELVDSIRTIRCPTLVATGELDPNSTPAMAERMAALIPGARAVVKS